MSFPDVLPPAAQTNQLQKTSRQTPPSDGAWGPALLRPAQLPSLLPLPGAPHPSDDALTSVPRRGERVSGTGEHSSGSSSRSTAVGQLQPE